MQHLEKLIIVDGLNEIANSYYDIYPDEFIPNVLFKEYLIKNTNWKVDIGLQYQVFDKKYYSKFPIVNIECKSVIDIVNYIYGKLGIEKTYENREIYDINLHNVAMFQKRKYINLDEVEPYFIKSIQIYNSTNKNIRQKYMKKIWNKANIKQKELHIKYIS